MKSTTFLFTLLLLVFASQLVAAQSPYLMVSGDKIEVNITRKATKAELLELKKELLDKHQIQVDFTALGFDKKGRLESIAMSVKAPNGNSGTCQTNRVRGKRGAFFMVDNTPGAKTRFSIGAGKKR
ncbi:MAG: hypothetical protein MUC59_18660 [Saprospiraceae bacterium]|jgi:hypothetical protein|nr:hypothetical protein [Saprospiraceae bacterium]